MKFTDEPVQARAALLEADEAEARHSAHRDEQCGADRQRHDSACNGCDRKGLNHSPRRAAM